MSTGERIVLASGGKVKIEPFDIPRAGPFDVLVRTRLTQISAGSETIGVRARRSGRAADNHDRPMGYISVGEVEAVGTSVSGFAPGDRVLGSAPHASHWLVTTGDHTSTESGVPRPDEEALVRLPDDLDDASAAFATLGDVALHGVRRAQIAIGESVAVHGQGVVGLLALRLAALSGAYPLIGVDLLDERLRMSTAFGASHVVNAASQDVAEAIRAATPTPRRFTGPSAFGLEPTSGADVQIYATARVDLLPELVRAAADRGRIIMIGANGTPADSGPSSPLGLDVLLRREISIVGSYETGTAGSHPYWPWTRSRNRTIMLDLIRRGRIDVRSLMTHVVPYTDAPAMYDMLARGGQGWLSVAFTWNG